MLALLIVAFIVKANVASSGKLLGRVRLCKHVEAKIERSLSNLTSILPNPKLGRHGAPVVKTRKSCSIFASAF